MSRERDLDGWLEHTTVGAMYVATLGFAALGHLGIYDLKAVGSALTAYVAYIVPALFAASYIIGTTIALLIPVVADLLPERWRRAIRGERYVALEDETGHFRYVQFLSKGSDNLVQAVHASWRAMRLFQGLFLAVPTFSVAFCIWASHTAINALVAPTAVLGCLATAVMFVAQRAQYGAHYRMAVAARDEIRRELEARSAKTLHPIGDVGANQPT
jgi:hypothetical protein